MRYVIFLLLFWLAFLLLLDRRRWRELYPTFLFAGFACSLGDLLGTSYGLWTYHGYPLPLKQDLLGRLGGYPVLATLFIQHRPAGWRARLGYWLAWAAAATLGEWLFFARPGLVTYGHGWSIYWSFLAHATALLAIAWQHGWYTRSRP